MKKPSLPIKRKHWPAPVILTIADGLIAVIQCKGQTSKDLSLRRGTR